MLSAPVTVQTFSREGEKTEQTEELLLEYTMDIYVDKKRILQCICTSEDLDNLVIGRLFTEGILGGIHEIQDCVIHAEEHCAYVVLKKDGGSCREKEKEKFYWKPEWIFKLADTFAEDTDLHSRTSCTHSCFLAQQDTVLYRAEDIGRHNAVDKAIGWALKNHIEPENCILYTSGRIPTDMMQKVIRARIPLVVSNAVPTKDAVILAEENRVSLIGRARRTGMKVYTDFRK